MDGAKSGGALGEEIPFIDEPGAAEIVEEAAEEMRPLLRSTNAALRRGPARPSLEEGRQPPAVLHTYPLRPSDPPLSLFWTSLWATGRGLPGLSRW